MDAPSLAPTAANAARSSRGALIGWFLSYLLAPTQFDRDFRSVALFVGIVTALGAAAGFLSRTGWAMLGGAAGGAIVTGIGGVIVTMHPKGLIYSFIGVPIGAVLVMLYRLEREARLQCPGRGVRVRPRPRRLSPVSGTASSTGELPGYLYRSISCQNRVYDFTTQSGSTISRFPSFVPRIAKLIAIR